MEFRIINRNQEVRWIAHISQAAYDEDGIYLGIRGSNRDITDRKKSEDGNLSRRMLTISVANQ